jgi:hypothetical protein
MATPVSALRRLRHIYTPEAGPMHARPFDTQVTIQQREVAYRW